jgi:hypothetical protein
LQAVAHLAPSPSKSGGGGGGGSVPSLRLHGGAAGDLSATTPAPNAPPRGARHHPGGGRGGGFSATVTGSSSKRPAGGAGGAGGGCCREAALPMETARLLVGPGLRQRVRSELLRLGPAGAGAEAVRCACAALEDTGVGGAGGLRSEGRLTAYQFQQVLQAHSEVEVAGAQ